MELHDAARTGDQEKLDAVLAKGVANLEQLDRHKRTALHLAAWAGHTEVVQSLLTNKANPKAGAMDDMLPLHFAAQKGHTEICRLLINQGTQVNSKTRKGLNALHFAVQNGHLETVNLLLKRKADPRSANKKGDTTLSMAKDDAIRDVITAALAAPRIKLAPAEAAEKVQSGAEQPTIGPSLGPFANRSGDVGGADGSAGVEGSGIDPKPSPVADGRQTDAQPGVEALDSGPAAGAVGGDGGMGDEVVVARVERQSHVRKRGDDEVGGGGGDAAGVSVPSKPSKRPVLSHLADDEED